MKHLNESAQPLPTPQKNSPWCISRTEHRELSPLGDTLLQDKPCFDIHDLGKVLSWSESQCWRKVKLGVLPKPFHLSPGGGSARWLVTDILAFIESRISTSSKEAPNPVHKQRAAKRVAKSSTKSNRGNRAKGGSRNASA